MWEESLTIRNPFGLSVFGSALIKTPPDLVSIHANVARKEIRARARRLAIAAAREKAQIYADAAGVSVGSLLHIQDVNPQVLQGRGESHVQREPVIDNDTDRQTLDPGAIAVGAAVMVAFSLLDVDK